MTDESGRKPIQRRTSKRRKPLGKRQLAADLTATRLYIPDRLLFQETARRKHVTDAELLRDIVHRWCVVERRAPGSQEDLQEQVLINLQNEALAGIKSIVDRLDLLTNVTSSFGESLNVNEAQLSRLIKTSNAQQNIVAQIFAVEWALLELVRRIYGEMLSRLASGSEARAEIDRYTDNSSYVGLRLVHDALTVLQSPQPIVMELLRPEAESTETPTNLVDPKDNSW
jgi:hypothetical protein